MASDQPRNGPRSRCGTASRLPITSIGIFGGEILDQVDLVTPSHRVEEAAHQRFQIGGKFADRRGVSAPAMSLRTRVCNGGSLKTRLVVWCS